jgi:hypothetical protein
MQFLFLQKMTDFKEQCICIKFLFQIGKIGAETIHMLTFAFRKEAVRQTVVFGCSVESRNGMTSTFWVIVGFPPFPTQTGTNNVRP